MSEFGKRALNKAQTRLDVLNALYRLSEETNFRDLKVKSIAESANITEMTFFNYFQKKEDILKYMMGLWALDVMVLQHKEPLSGEKAIRRIFSHTATEVKKHPRLIVNFIASMITKEVDPMGINIESADRYLLYPELPELFETPLPTGNEMIMQHLTEIDPQRDHIPTFLRLASCFYGDMLVAHTAELDIEMLYNDSLDMIFRSMKDG